MSYVARSDAELLAFAREGVASAFAVLVYRHGPEILELAQGDPDPVGAVVATYIRAMRALPNANPGDVRRWLLGFAAEEIEGEIDLPAASAVGAAGASGGHSAAATGREVPQASNVTARTVAPGRDPMDAPPFETDDDLDEVWAELALRWPTGRVPRHLPSWAIWVITTVVLIALAILLPWAVLGASGEDAETIEELSASPVLEDLTLQEEEDDEDDVEEQELPTFDFPEPPENDAEAGSNQDTAPPPDPGPDTTEDADDVDQPDDTTGDEAGDEDDATGADGDPVDDTGDETDGDTGDETDDDTGDETTGDTGDQDDPAGDGEDGAEDDPGDGDPGPDDGDDA